MENLTPLERLTTEFVTYRHSGVVRIQVDQSTIDEMLAEQNKSKPSNSKEYDEKLKFFAQYYGQDCLTVGNANCDNISEHWGEDVVLKTQYLLLTPLSAITDEDAIEVARFVGLANVELHRLEKSILFKDERYAIIIDKDGINMYYGGNIWTDDNTRIVDKLRSLGIAYEWMGLSVEELVSMNWIKLKEG